MHLFRPVLTSASVFELFLGYITLDRLSMAFTSRLSAFGFIIVRVLAFTTSLLGFYVESSITVSGVSIVLSSTLSLRPCERGSVGERVELGRCPRFFVMVFFKLGLVLLLVLLTLFVGR